MLKEIQNHSYSTEDLEREMDRSNEQDNQLLNQYDDVNPDVKCLAELEGLLRALAGQDEHTNSKQAELLLLQSFSEYVDVVAKLPNEYEYSEYLNAFIAVCEEARLFDFSIVDINDTSKRVILAWISQVRRDCQGFEFREKLRIQQREADRRYEEYAGYIDALFDKNDRLIVLRLDLGYEKRFAKNITLEMALEDIDKLMNNRRNNRLFDHMVGYILKTEFGIDRRIHFHTIFFFNGSRRQGRAHIRLAQEIGEYWCNSITQGEGNYWNCNRQIDEFERRGRCGIGEIHWSDEISQSNLKEHVLAYLCKTDQGFRPRQHPKAKLMRRGAVPEVREVRRGRLRILEGRNSQ